MPTTDRDIGQNLQRLRYIRRLTQAELAQRVGLDRTAISRIEAGSRSLSATELVRFAQALKTPVEELVQPASAPSQSPTLTRLLLRSGPAGSLDEPQLAWFVELIEKVVPAESGQRLPAVNRRLQALPAAAAGEIGAGAVRRWLGLGVRVPVAGLSGLLARRGIGIASVRFASASRLSGCVLTLPAGLSAILVNSNHPRTRQRFTLAHELGHLLFDADHAASACDAGEIRPGRRSHVELRADAFAAAFLLPRRALLPLADAPLNLEHLHALATAYGASHAATVQRLREMGLLADEEARVLRKLGGRPQPVRDSPPFRLVGESLAALVGDAGSRRGGDEHGYDVVADGEVIA